MKLLGDFTYNNTVRTVSFPKDELRTGLNDRENFIIRRNEDGAIDFVINKVCDHAGGNLIVKGTEAVCPLHGWKLNLATLRYNDSHVSKEKINFSDQGENILVEKTDKEIYNPFKGEKKGIVQVRWLNHACVHIECNGVKLITDPWLFGPAFMTGWWLSQPSPSESIELLRNADYLYISHNHPDHLHPETLAVIPKDKPILVANFTSKSCEKYLRSLDFTNIIPLDFLKIYEMKEHFQVSILKSGDFRDDSGLYICANGHGLLFTVDCNFLNGYILPRNIDLLLTSFAGVASGFPLCFNNYSEPEKQNILKRNRGTMLATVKKYIDATQPIHYMPYAGMFKERAKRDGYIFQNNKKNTYDDYRRLLNSSSTQLLEPNSAEVMIFSDGVGKTASAKTQPMQPEHTDLYTDKLKEEYPYDTKKIIDYLERSGFTGNQIIQFIPTDDDFSNTIAPIIYADFNDQVFKVIEAKELVSERAGMNVMKLFIRAEILMCVIENKLPWEDFSIGYQMRVERSPNEYESKLWYHFTNIYIGTENFRYSSYCGSCTVINQNPIWNKTVS